jgi:hypothetical protein
LSLQHLEGESPFLTNIRMIYTASDPQFPIVVPQFNNGVKRFPLWVLSLWKEMQRMIVFESGQGLLGVLVFCQRGREFENTLPVPIHMAKMPAVRSTQAQIVLSERFSRRPLNFFLMVSRMSGFHTGLWPDLRPLSGLGSGQNPLFGAICPDY